MKIITINEYKPDKKLKTLLQQRKAPLSTEAMQKVLQELTAYMSEDLDFLIAAFLRPDVSEDAEIIAADIEKADIMIDAEDQRYLPVFTASEDFLRFKPEMKKDEKLLLCKKKDLLDFLNLNEKVAAAVINPMNDDLILYRVNLRNMIQVEKFKD
jgi:hypothetical protein